MVYSEGAKIIPVNELIEMIDEKFNNPTIDRLMFIETRSTAEVPGKVFPCYLEGYELEKTDDPDNLISTAAFLCCIMQYIKGEFKMIRVRIPASKFGVSKRIWDKPPTKGLRDDYPFLDSEEAQ